MKKFTSLLVFYLIISFLIFTGIASFGQGLLITPQNTISDNTSGDNFSIRSNSIYIGLQSIRYNGTNASKSPVINGDYLLRIGAGGYYATNLTDYTQERASIYFKANQDWSSTAKGTRISFATTPNNDVNAIERMTIANNGNVGIGIEEPTGIFQINRPDPLDPRPNIHLQSPATFGFGTSSSIKASGIDRTGGWTNRFTTTNVTHFDEVSWIHSPSGKVPLRINGLGDAYIQENASIGGYTNLGDIAPKIKMKELSLTTSAAAGGEVAVAHGLTQSKIVSVSVLVNSVSGNDIPPSYSTTKYAGYLYFFWVTDSGITIENSDGNHTSIANRPARILITYKE